MSSTSAQGLTALSSTLLGLATITITLRFYARHVQRAPVKSDDWFMVPCLLLFIGTTACTFYGVHKKVLGYPTPKDRKEVADTAEMTSKLYLAFDLFSTTTLGCTKVGALLFFRRIFCVTGQRTFFSYLILISITVVAFWTAGYDILTGLACGTHFSALWTSRGDYDHYCRTTAWRFLLSLTISDFLLDIWILALPLPQASNLSEDVKQSLRKEADLHQIWTLQTSLRRRVGVMGVFLLALVGLAACIARLAFAVQTFNAGPNVITDARLVNTRQLYFSVLENGLSLISINLPSLWCLFTHAQLESVLRSVRSIISLRSSDSGTTSGRRPPASRSTFRAPLAKNGSDPVSSDANSETHFAPSEAQSFETYAMRDIKEGDLEHGLPRGKIQITDSITQSTANV